MPKIGHPIVPKAVIVPPATITTTPTPSSVSKTVHVNGVVTRNGVVAPIPNGVSIKANGVHIEVRNGVTHTAQAKTVVLPGSSPEEGSGLPRCLKPYHAHGVRMNYKTGASQVQGTCPFCDKDKWYINPLDGLWDCKVCGLKGNVYKFIRELHKLSFELPGIDDEYAELAADRKLLDPDTLRAWGVVKSATTGEWLVPGYGVDGEINQLYRYVSVSSGKRALMATPELPHALHMPDPDMYPIDTEVDTVYFAEGPWDGMAWWEMMRILKDLNEDPAKPQHLVLTGAEDLSLASKSMTFAVPGCNVFQEGWGRLLANKHAIFMYDNDHPKPHPSTGKPMSPAGLEGTKKAVQTLMKAESKPSRVSYLEWSPLGHDPDLASGWDIRDYLSSSDASTPKERVANVDSVMSRFQPIPHSWVDPSAPGHAKDHKKKVAGSLDIALLKCEKWSDLINQWRKPMNWTEGLDRALSVMLASVISTPAVGDQLWVKIVSPPSTGKSVLCEALSVNKDFCLAKSTIRGFHSGYRETADENEDNSLLAQVSGKTLITKDGDTLLQSPNLSQILSEARDVYDRTSRTHYRNKSSKDYEGISMTWILCGTSSLRSLDSSELGERFLDCIIMDKIDDELEDDILYRVANRTRRGMALKSNADAGNMTDPDMLKAMQMTGGYIDYLRLNAQRLLEKVDPSDDSIRRCVHLGKFVAYMRARPSEIQEEIAEREFGARLVSQMIRLAMCIAAVLNKTDLDGEVMRRTTRVALDTARGRTLELAKYLYESGDKGLELKTLALFTNQTEQAERTMLKFMKGIGIAEFFKKELAPGVVGRPHWRLTSRLHKLYAEVVHSS